MCLPRNPDHETDLRPTCSRRHMMASLAGGLVAAAARPLSAATAPRGGRQFTMDLVCGAIGVKANQRQAIELAAEFGFESVQPSAGELARMDAGQRGAIVQLLKEKGLVWGAAGLPVDFRRDESTFTRGLEGLPRQAAALQRAGAGRISTWIRPAHDTLTYLQNFRQHAARLKQVARVVGDAGLRLGLEYVGPKTSWTVARYPFIHTLAEMRELIAEIGGNNVGLVLDSWHWYTAHETADDLKQLTDRDIVACDLNDAPAGLQVDDQVDNRRELPAATGVINLKAFLTSLVEIGYRGPVRVEPFNDRLRKMDDREAVAATSAALHRAVDLITP